MEKGTIYRISDQLFLELVPNRIYNKVFIGESVVNKKEDEAFSQGFIFGRIDFYGPGLINKLFLLCGIGQGN
jgi:hypothetical protein